MLRAFNAALAVYVIGVGIYHLAGGKLTTERFGLSAVLIGVGLQTVAELLTGTWSGAASATGGLLVVSGITALIRAESARRRVQGIPPLMAEYRAGAGWLVLVFAAGALASVAPSFDPPYNGLLMYGGAVVMVVATVAWLVMRRRHHVALDPRV